MQCSAHTSREVAETTLAKPAAHGGGTATSKRCQLDLATSMRFARDGSMPQQITGNPCGRSIRLIAAFQLPVWSNDKRAQRSRR